MRIAQIHWAFHPTIGGVETHLALLGPALVGRGHSVHLLCGEVEGVPRESVFGGMTIRRTPWLDLNRYGADDLEAHGPEIREAIGGFLAEAAPDLIHIHNMHYFGSVPVETILRFGTENHVPVVLTAHNVWNDRIWEKLLAYRERYDRVIAVSRYIREELERSGYPEERLRVVHHGLPEDWWANGTESGDVPFADWEGLPVVFHPARLGLGKGSGVVIDAFATVQRAVPEARLLLAGEGQIVDWGHVQESEVMQIRRRVREYGLEPSVRIRHFQWQEMAGAYRLARAVVYPSIMQEPFGIVVIEAMATGRPVVVSHSGGMPEIVEDGLSGRIVPIGDAAALADVLIELLTSPATAHRLGQAARERVGSRFTLNRMVDETMKVYTEVLERERGVSTHVGGTERSG